MSDAAKPRTRREQDTGEYNHHGYYPVCCQFFSEFQRIEGLENLVNLEELWLGKNKIVKLEVCFVTLVPCHRDVHFSFGRA